MAAKAGGKAHRKAKAGNKAQKRKQAVQKKQGVLEQATAQRQNPRAFAFQSARKAKASHARSAEREQRRLHAPLLDPSSADLPPFVVLVQGPPQVGKSTLIRCLVKHYSRQNLGEVRGPVTVVAGKKRRVTFVECPPDLPGMLDAAKFADLVLLVIDGSFGFEMETFEFLNLLQVHGFPKVMGVLTHLDGFADQAQLKKTKKKLKARFWTEIYDGAKLFYLSGIQHGKYLKREVLNLARFISVTKDLTSREVVRTQPACDRDVVVYGWLRGTNMALHQRLHWAGVGDFTVQELDALPDPCPIPDSSRKRGLNDRERLIYAPMSDLGGLLYDKDAVYIDIPNWKVQYSTMAGPVGRAGDGGGEGDGQAAPPPATEGEAMVRGLQAASRAVDEALAASSIRLFQSSKPLAGDAQPDGDDSDEDEEGEDGNGSGSSSDGEEGSEAGSEWSEDEAAQGPADGARGQAAAGLPRSRDVRLPDGRVRRKALFADDSVPVEGGGSGSEGEEGEATEGEGEEDEEAYSDDEGLGGATRWKSMLGSLAQLRPGLGDRDLAAWVYGTPATAGRANANGGQAGTADAGGSGSDDDEDGDDLFVLRGKRTAAAPASELTALDALDTSRVLLPLVSSSHAGLEADYRSMEGLRDRFVTGDWTAGAARAAAHPSAPGEEDDEGEQGEEGDDGEVYGEFEDIETGAKFGADGDPVTRAAQHAIEAARAQELREAKAAKKAAFDSQYDTRREGGGNGAGGSDDEGGEPEAGPAAAKPGRKPGDPKEETYYDAVKAEMAARAARSRAALDALPAGTRVAMEGLRPGAYVRVRLTGVPCELVEHLDPSRPLLLGGLGQVEDKAGVMKMRFKRHRWFPKLLKTRDPLVFSIGWRRFQSLPVYCLEDHNRRLRMLKYTPEHMHCLAAVYGPLAPQNTGVVAIQSLGAGAKGWRVSATGVVLELDAEVRVMKKLKLVGTPAHINRNTAFIKGMFTSQLEAARFEGASVRSVSGIRGTIKKAVRPGGVLRLREGTVRATFEDKLLLSDIVFLRAWVSVDIPRFVNPVTNLLEPHPVVARAPKPSKKKSQQLTAAVEGGAASTAPSAPKAASAGTPAQPAKDVTARVVAGQAVEANGAVPEFIASPRFRGARPGMVFKKGQYGLGYYRDGGPAAAAAALPQPAVGGGPAPTQPGAAGQQSGGAAAPAAAAGWVPMRTVAALRRDAGLGAPRTTDSLYRPIERAPRKFNPLHIPKALQAALPFKTKPKLEAARKPGAPKTLDQKRAVVMEPHERRAATLLQQLNAIRNDKAEKRRQQQARRNVERDKRLAKEAEWRDALNKERRKERFRAEGQAQKRKEMAMGGKGGGKVSKRRKASDD